MAIYNESITPSQPSLFRPASGGSKAVRTYGLDRVCSVEGCTTRLSIYNPSRVCSVHAHLAVKRPRRAVTGVLLTKSCAFDGCAKVFQTPNPRRIFCSDRCRMRAFQARSAAGAHQAPPQARAA
jgi:hypothetical protein